MTDPVIITIIITNVVLVLSNVIAWMRKIKKSSCCGGELEMQRDSESESEQNKKKKSKK